MAERSKRLLAYVALMPVRGERARAAAVLWPEAEDGRTTEVRRSFAELRRLTWRELGIEPSASLHRLVDRGCDRVSAGARSG